MMLKAHCKDCKDRHPGCHDTCEDYQACKREYEAAKKRAREYDLPMQETSRRLLQMAREKRWRRK